MRSPALLAIAALTAGVTLSTPQAVDARLFWQTYGATVATPQGCAWNLNSDYFVPRTCESGRYDLFSPCKASHSRSPACKNLHPVYTDYCTPYGECHYKWRDHVYKKYCGCSPLRCVHGPWRLDHCHKGHKVFRPGAEMGGSSCGLGDGNWSEVSGGAGCHGRGEFAASGGYFLETTLPNVEPLGGELLGSIPAFPVGTGAAGGPSAMGVAPVGPGMQAPVGPVPALPADGGAMTIPALFGN